MGYAAEHNMQADNMQAQIERALTIAGRGPGWNSRACIIRTIDLGACTLYVVPFRCWVNRHLDNEARICRQLSE
jgi:hypothetical protein